MRVNTIVHIVLKFQMDRACFHGEEAGANSGEKWDKKKERKNRAYAEKNNVSYLRKSC